MSDDVELSRFTAACYQAGTVLGGSMAELSGHLIARLTMGLHATPIDLAIRNQRDETSPTGMREVPVTQDQARSDLADIGFGVPPCAFVESYEWSGPNGRAV